MEFYGGTYEVVHAPGAEKYWGGLTFNPDGTAHWAGARTAAVRVVGSHLIDLYRTDEKDANHHHFRLSKVEGGELFITGVSPKHIEGFEFKKKAPDNSVAEDLSDNEPEGGEPPAKKAKINFESKYDFAMTFLNGSQKKLSDMFDGLPILLYQYNTF
jgi:hypothetical protein